jgi:hypothetical protein
MRGFWRARWWVRLPWGKTMHLHLVRERGGHDGSARARVSAATSALTKRVKVVFLVTAILVAAGGAPVLIGMVGRSLAKHQVIPASEPHMDHPVLHW